MSNNLKILDLTILSPDCSGGGSTEEVEAAANVSRFSHFIAGIKIEMTISSITHMGARIDINENGQGEQGVN